MRRNIQVLLRNRLIASGLEKVLSPTEKPCIASYLRQLSADINMKNYKINKTGFSLIIFHFNIRGKLSIIQCDNYY